MGKWAIKWNFQPFMTSDGTLWNISWYKIPFKSLSRSNTAYNGPQGWGAHVIVSLWYWFILRSLLSDRDPSDNTLGHCGEIYCHYIVIRSHWTFTFYGAKVWSCVMDQNRSSLCEKSVWMNVLMVFLVSVLGSEILTVSGHGITQHFPVKQKVGVRKNPCLNCCLKVAPWQSEDCIFRWYSLLVWTILWHFNTKSNAVKCNQNTFFQLLTGNRWS